MMQYRAKQMMIEHYPIQTAVAVWGSPLYLYSQAAIENNWHRFEKGCKNKNHLICYAVKANSNLSILRLFASLGAGFDIVSQGELERVLIAGGDPQKIIFSGVGKTTQEIERALEVGIYCFNVESLPELERINEIAQKNNLIAPIALRVNPNIPIKAHPYITTGMKHNKFGMSMEQAWQAYQYAYDAPALHIRGISCHLGSQIIELSPFVSALEKLLKFTEKLAKNHIALEFIDVGGGLGIRYQKEKPVSVEKYLAAIWQKMKKQAYRVVFEPGRVLIGDAGLLVTKIEYLKKTKTKNFAIVDASMSELMRPALYEAWHTILPVVQRAGRKVKYDVVGPVCESGDFLGLDRPLVALPGDLLVVCDVGAYGFSLSSNYNTRPRVAEVWVSGKQATLIRERENFSDLWEKEKIT